jgi:regulator of PEP synthase PpsR (kinase-PPPase family)
MTDEQKNIVIIADSTGATAKRLMDAVLSQYAQAGLLYSLTATHQQVRDKATIDRILKDIPDDTLVLYSIVSEKLSKYLRGKLKEREILHLDVLEPMLKVMSKFLGVHPDYRPGILQIISDRYYKKIDAIGFTVEHDDGRGQLIEQADVVLLGLSRTCKTPVSMYLACNYGLKVANIPVVHEQEMARELVRRLKHVPQRRIIGLLMRPEVLAYVRQERASALTQAGTAGVDLLDYYDRRLVTLEHRFCVELFQSLVFATVDVTRRAIEEISLEILEQLGIEDFTR